MLPEKLKDALKFYFITDDAAPALSPAEQAQIAIRGGASFVQYRNKAFSSAFFGEARAVRDLCKCNGIPFVVNDDILLAKAIGADGVHLGQEDDSPRLARQIMGEAVIVGVSVSTLSELERTDLAGCDYIGTGPVFRTGTKADAKPVIGLSGLAAVVKRSPVPVVAIGGIDNSNAAGCFDHGAAGVAVISCISRAKDPAQSARRLGRICGCTHRKAIDSPWNDEFGLIRTLLQRTPAQKAAEKVLKIPPGDDAALLHDLTHPVVTTDTHKEGVHFRLDWQTPAEVGRKAVSITLSDLAAKYARPVCLFVNLSLPEPVSNRFVETLYEGMAAALETYACALGGGNISRGTELSIDLFAIGQGRDDLFPERSAAQPGDGLYCTGPLGLARAGLHCLVRKDMEFPSLIDRFKSPTARFDAADVLAGNRVACVMDISDGLAGDGEHIARASRLTVQFDLDPDDFDPALVSFCSKHGISAEEMVLGGGEDYELLFACHPKTFVKIKKALPGALPVGRCVPFTGAHLANLPAGISSFQHGKKV